MALISFKGSPDEDYIDMEISYSNTLFPYSTTSSSSSPSLQHHNNNKEFEFQMSSSLASDQDSQTTTTFPADELFYQGKLLPLHLPPRLQMVQNILQTSSNLTAIKLSEDDEAEEDFDFEEETFTIPFMSFTAPCTNTNTPIDQSCNISPSESCRVSCELLRGNDLEYLSEDQYWSTQVRSVLIGGPTGRSTSSKKSISSSWSTKLKQSSFGKKLVKASRAYLKSLFLHRSACSDGSGCAKSSTTTTTKTPTCNVGHEEKCAVLSKTSTFGRRRMISSDNKMISATSLMKSIENEITAESGTTTTATTTSGVTITSHRKSFSGVIQRHNSGKNNKSLLSNSTSSSGSSSSSSSFSLSSNGTSSYDLQWLKRCSSASLELESSIEGAIAHCKQSLTSQQFFSSRSKSTTNKVGYGANFSMAASRIAV